MEKFQAVMLAFFKNFGTSLLEAVALLLFGIVVIKLAKRLLNSVLRKTHLEPSASSFVVSLIQAALALILFFLVLDIFNIDTSSIVAIVAASGLAIGLALQDSLSNISSGIILLFTKPFKENDKIRVGSVEGNVKRIKITTTELLTADNILLSIPNSKVISSEIVNYSARPVRRVDMVVSAAYGSDIEKVKNVILTISNQDERVLKDPAATVNVSALAESAVNYTVKMWTKTENYWDIYNSFYEKVLVAFAKENIEVPYNKLDVKLIAAKEEN